MRTSLVLSICVATLLAVTASDLMAQARPPVGGGAPPVVGGGSAGRGAGGVVAVLDFSHVMKNFVRAKQYQERFQKDVEDATAALRKEQAQIEVLREKMKDYKPGTQDYKRRDEELAQRVSDFQLRQKIQQRDFSEREARTMFQLYSEISDEVKRYAEANGIATVMIAPTDAIDPSSPDAIQRAMSKPFIYHGGPDITDAITQELNRRAVTAHNQPKGGQAPLKK